ncbi:hypothetical protein D3C87_1864540 [compost metagenome]
MRPVISAVPIPSEKLLASAPSAPALFWKTCRKLSKLMLSNASPPEIVRDMAVARIDRSGTPVARNETMMKAVSTGHFIAPSGRLSLAVGLPLTVW